MYAPYRTDGSLNAPPPHGGHGGGHIAPHGEHAHPIARGGRRDWGWGFPWLPVTTVETCSTWGDPVKMSVAMTNAANAALDTSSGRPTTVRGPDNVLYLFSLENGVPTARPCAAMTGLGAAPSSMQWFLVQRLSATPAGLTSAQYIGPFYGDPSSVTPLMRTGDYVLVYVNGTWTEL